MYAIEFQNFSCYYKLKNELISVLRQIDLSVEEGEFFMVLGASGCGKTTLLRCIMGLGEYIQGQLFVGGIAIDDFSLKQANIGFVGQKPELYPHMTVYENLAFPLRTIHTPQQETDRRVRQMADVLGLGLLLTRKPRQLSGGQQQLVALGRAMIKHPVLLLLDEPFASLDPNVRSQLRPVLKRLHQLYRCTVVMVTHDQTDVWSLADRVVCLENGQRTALGTPQSVLGALD